MVRTVVIYHGGCWDGFCAAWLLRTPYPDAEFIPARYGDMPPMEKIAGNMVFVVDFSYPRDILIDMYRAAASLVVLDHHKTAQEDLEGLSFCKFDMNKSGARMVFEYFYGDTRCTTWLVNYTEDRDLWLWKLPDSREINAALRSYPLDFDTWDLLDNTSLSRMVSEGKAIMRWQEQVVAAKVEQSHVVKVLDVQWRVANATTLVSETAGALAEKEGFVGCCWFEGVDGSRHYSLRSQTVDVSEIARTFGGGGHAKAAGFKLDSGGLHPWHKWCMFTVDTSKVRRC